MLTFAVVRLRLQCIDVQFLNYNQMISDHKKFSLTVSVVSHGQAKLVSGLLDDLEALSLPGVQIIITLNIPEDEDLYISRRLNIKVIRNLRPLGFGANHNAAFQISDSEYFAVVNPDIRLKDFDLHALMLGMLSPTVGAVGPLVINPAGGIEATARSFPTVFGLFLKALTGDRESRVATWAVSSAVDWVAGMFIIFRSTAFDSVKGFDSVRYFMYYEDVDICSRLWRAGWSVIFNPSTTVIHDARRASRHNYRHLMWHLTSATRYLTGI